MYDSYVSMQQLMLAFASGGLLGDVILHAIPHLMIPHKHSENHDHHEEHDHHDDHEAHSHAITVGCSVLFGFLIFFVSERFLSLHFSGHHNCNHSNSSTTTTITTTLPASSLLNIAADMMHNFTDGLAIGAAYASHSSSLTSIGLATTLSVLFHEVPHEVADFTILVQGGMR